MRQMATTPENITGTIKKYFQLRKVTTTKQAARLQATSRIYDK